MSELRASIAEWFRPPASPPALRFAATSEEVLERMGEVDDANAEQVLALAEAANDEAFQRAESAERRATTIQGAIAIAASLSLAGGSLLLDAKKVPDGCWSWALGMTYALAISALAVVAWRAFLVTWPRFMWASPSFEEVYDLASAPNAAEIKRRRAADLFVAYGRNDRIAAVKVGLLGSALRWLVAALALIALLAVLVAGLAIDHDPATP